ncbi:MULTISPECIES: hypothetical protein [unclassified Streptomyces]|uniref:hypothetical protein n=1 Tax=unclassified Streptomyces TaxID=2593676 RepID=UPI0023666D67|nr:MULTISPECIES: hypothetical protein [unclassified Streptomyces]MDF3147298.1 hypothetical protein [Streptomyces sp. T21Q-yed]WDF40288.1 hypothetical protein PBV52_27650 [Streptomyces sp. T12]
MGSLRNPVGPLPSSIYWRRRVVMLSVVAVLALLTTWVLTSGGGGGKNNAGGSDGKNPEPSTITPGPSTSGPAISQAPGGRDESPGGGDSGGSGSGDGSGTGTGDDGSDGSGGSDDSGSGSAGGGSGTGVGVDDTVAAGSTLTDCIAGAVKLTVSSLHNAYEPGRTPALLLTATNTSSYDCKIDLGPKNSVVTITQAGAEDDFWSSADCPKVSGSLVFRVPAGSKITYTVKWDRQASAPQCATPAAGSAEAGTYLVEAKTPGFGTAQTSFVLEND